MGVVGAEQEEYDGDAGQKLLGRGILSAIVDLLPHVEVVIGSRVELEGYAADIVEHEVGSKHVRNIGQGP